MLLVFGLLLWSGVHLLPAYSPSMRQGLINRTGMAAYKSAFALLILTSLTCIVLGFQAMPIDMWYVSPGWTRHITMLLMLIAVVLLVAAQIPSDIKRVIRHPQLIGVKTWALAHLLSNGESRSVLLFGGLLTWAVLEVIFINRRDGEWAKPEPRGASRSIMVFAIGVTATIGLLFAHPYLAGVALISR